jgi:hypothetical protein
LSIEPLRIHPAALEEAEAALNWYAQRSRRAADRFLMISTARSTGSREIRGNILYMSLAHAKRRSGGFRL